MSTPPVVLARDLADGPRQGGELGGTALGGVPVHSSFTETVANAFENTKGLRAEAFQAANGVTVSDTAGARYVSRGDALRIRGAVRTTAA